MLKMIRKQVNKNYPGEKSKVHTSGKGYYCKLLLAFPTTESEIEIGNRDKPAAFIN